MKNKKRFTIIVVMISVLVIGLTGTFAWYVWSGQDKNLVSYIKTSVGAAQIFYDAGADIVGRDLKPVSDKSLGIVKKITVTTDKVTTNAISFNLYLDINELPNELKDSTFKYAVYDSDDNEVVVGNFADANLVGCDTNGVSHIVLMSNEIVNNISSVYILYIWIDGTVNNNPAMAGKNFSFTLHADGQNALFYDKSLVSASVDGLYEGYSCDASTQDCTLKFLGSNINRDQITSVTFVENNVVPEGAISGTDVSSVQDNSIMLWYTENTSKSTDTEKYYDAYIGGNDDKVYIRDGGYLFYGLTNVETIDFGGVVDTTAMYTMASMFNGCEKLINLDVSSFDTSNVVDMSRLFSKCYLLTTLDVSEWDTGNVTNMAAVFQVCISLEELDLSKWNVSNVTTMSHMFLGKTATPMILESVGDVSNWDVSNVTDMQYMFQKCQNLKTIDVGKWNVSNVTNMAGMFLGCSGLMSLDVSKWDVSNVTNMIGTFQQCSNLEVIDVSEWNVSNVTIMRGMFGQCQNLETIDVSKWNVSNVTNMQGMFEVCHQFVALDVSGWNTSKVTNMQAMFNGCINLTFLDVSGWNTSKVTNMKYMFANCYGLLELDLSSFNTSNVIDMTYMFNYSNKLQTIYVSNLWVINSGLQSTGMFAGSNAIVGGAGTTYNANYIDKTYARVDGGINSPGYFTYKEAFYVKSLISASVDGLYEGYSCDASTQDCTLKFLGSNINRDQITSVTFVDNNVVPSGVIGSADVSAVRDGSIMLWYTENTSKSTNTEKYYDVYIGGKDGKVYIRDGSYLFYNLVNVEEIDFGEVIDTTPMTTMAYMFTYCYELINLDVSSFDTSNVTNMSCSFARCYSLPSLDVSNWDTGKVTDMSSTFQMCTSIERLDLSNWDTSNVVLMTGMFLSLPDYKMALKSVGDLSNWDTSKVTDMSAMFQWCINLETLNISKWDVSNVTNMKNLFRYCQSLSVLDLSGWNPSKATIMSGMFSYCTNLQIIYVSNLWKTNTVTTSGSMFYDCTNLVGGSGTVFNASYINKTYARIDGGTASPGYFTYKAAPNV